MRLKISKQANLLTSLVVISSLVFLAFADMASAGTVDFEMTTNPCNFRLMDFENGNDGEPIASTIPGLQFITTDGNDWVIGDFATGNYNGKWPYGIFTSDGYKWAWLGSSQSQGRIDFVYGTAAYFSILTSTESGLTLEALSANGDLLDSASAGPNTDTGWMTRLTVNVSDPDISYIRVHDTGNFFLVDDICTDAPAEPALVNGPSITAYSPASPVYDISGAARMFNVTVNQTVNVNWYLNGNQVYTDESVTESVYTNPDAVEGSWNVTAVATNVNGTAMQVWDWIVTEPPTGPAIIDYSPPSPVNDTARETRTFNITINQSVTVRWFINGTQVGYDENVTESQYVKMNAESGSWNVTAVATNANGTAIQAWDWIVTEPVYGPSITAYSPESPAYDFSGAARAFSVTVNQSVIVRWFINGTQVGYDEGVTESQYVNTNAEPGSWNVTAVAINVNGTAMQAWNWIVTEPVYAPVITAYSPASPAYDISGIARTFNITVNQTVNIVWYLNDVQVYSQEAVTDSAYTNNNPAAGSWNVTAVATNANGTATQTWDWIVTEPIYAPAITAYSPATPAYDISGATRAFTVTVNQSVTVRWFVNGTQVGYDEDVTESQYVNTNAEPGSWNVTAVATNVNGTAMQTWDWIVTEPIYGPSITAYSPASPAYDTSGETRTFNVTVNQTANVVWYLDGNQVLSEEGVTNSAYTNAYAVTGSWNVTAVATNVNGTAMQTWDWIVTEPIYGPSITAYSPASPAYDVSGATRTFTVAINQSVIVRWFVDGTQVGYDEDVTDSVYTNTNAATGSWNVTAVATNVNGTAMQVWNWVVTEPVYAPAITAYSPESPAYDISGAARTFTVTVNQSVSVRWFIDGTQVGYDEGITESVYTNTNAATGSWNVTAVATNANGTAMQVWDWIVIEPIYGPSITAYSPASPVYDISGATRTFTVTVNQTVNVIWYLNGNQVQADEGITESAYTNNNAITGSWNVTAVATNVNGTAMQVWNWIVTEPVYAPAITAYSPASPAYDISGIARTFNITVNQTVNIVWYLNDAQVYSQEAVTDSAYTNNNPAAGSWNVTAVATNANGTAMQVWDWIVTEPPTDPAIIDHSPPSPVNDTAGAIRAFNITVNQSVTVRWFINGTQVGYDEGVTESQYVNTNAEAGSWNVTAVATNINGTAMQIWDWVVTEPVYAPAITAYSPASPAYDISGATRIFTVAVNQTVNIIWYLNGIQVYTDEGVTESAYANTNAATGLWNITAVATNVNGTAMQAWDWVVTEPIYAPAITAYSPASPVYDISGAARTFTVTINQSVTVRWFANGTQVGYDEGVTESQYVNMNAEPGSWNVTAVATNMNGTAMQTWDWIVAEPVYAPAITAYSPATPAYDISGATRTFTVTVNQTVNVVWYLDGNQVLTEEGVTNSAYTDTNAVAGSWNVTAVATNVNGTAMQVWDWVVTEPVYGPSITAYSPSSPAYDISGSARIFNITINQTVNVIWYLNGTQVYAQEDVRESAYTNISAAKGIWVINAVATNVNGTVSSGWIWNVSTQAQQDKINATIIIKPECLNLGSKGKLTAFITLPEGYNVTNINLSTVVLEGAHAVKGIVSGRNGGTLIVKFNRQDLINVPTGNAVILTVTGKVLHEGAWVNFEGSDTIRVMEHGKCNECAGEEREHDECDEHDGCKEDDKCKDNDGCKEDDKCKDNDGCKEDGKCKENDGCKKDNKCEENDGCKEDDKCKDNYGCKEDDKCKDNYGCKEDDKCEGNDDGCKEQDHQEDDEDGKSKDHSENEHHPDKSLKDKKAKNNKNFDK